MTTRSVSVVIPALNEAGNVGALVTEVFTAAGVEQFPARLMEVVVVDNGSTDQTAVRAAEAGARVVSEPRKGYGQSCLSGAIACEGADILVFMDGDRSEVPSELASLLAPLLNGEADLVIGSRVRGTVEPGALSFPQRAGNWIAAKALKALYGVRVSDLGPYRAIERTRLLQLGMTEMTYGWPAEMLARAAQAGLRVHEVPVTCRRRATGVSKVSGNPVAVVKTGWRILRTILSVRRPTVPRLKATDRPFKDVVSGSSAPVPHCDPELVEGSLVRGPWARKVRTSSQGDPSIRWDDDAGRPQVSANEHEQCIDA